MAERPLPQRIVTAIAPVRICDIGGWTDTWFAGHGAVLNIAVEPGIGVEVKVHTSGVLPAEVVLDVQNFGERYAFDVDRLPGRHPLLEAAIDEIGVPDGVSVEIAVSSEMPVGSSTGTSASMTVALLGALDSLSPGRLGPDALAFVAHRVETERLGMESGLQDQLCAAFGGINFIEISPYPHTSITSLTVGDDTWRELERRLVLVSLGHRHESSALHERVIAGLAEEGPEASPLRDLRRAALAARDALCRTDFSALGRAMNDNTRAQRRLNPDLVSADADTAIDVAAASGAVGWKVNGAGGDGGSLTLLCGPDPDARRVLQRALRDAGSPFEVVPTRLSRTGLRVWDSPAT